MKRALPIVVLLACAALFVAGLLHLFQLRFEAGDVYPPYSSLRADPLGAMALYESLERVRGLSVARDFTTANRLPDSPDTAYLHLAAAPSDWRSVPPDLFQEIERFVYGGGRLIVTLYPESASASWRTFTNRVPETSPKPGKPTDSTNAPPARPDRSRRILRPPDEVPGEHAIALRDRWGIGFAMVNLKQRDDDDTYEPVTVTNAIGAALPAAIPWHSGWVLTNLASAWRVVSARRGQPVVADRRFGRGTVVFATDSFFLSNEALQRERHAGLLAWLIGPSREVVFDEAHLGIAESPGIATLVRRYRLHGLVIALLVLAGLFVWKNASSLAPPYADAKDDGTVAGEESAAGFVSLLRRSIPSRDLLGTCVAEWEKTCGRRISAAQRQEIHAVLEAENALPPRERNPAAAYERICRIVGKRSEFHVPSWSQTRISPPRIAP